MPLTQQAKNKHKFSYYQFFFWGSFTCLALYIVYISRDVVFATHDDMQSYLSSLSLTFPERTALLFRSLATRARWDPISILGGILSGFILSSKNLLLYKLFLYLPILASILAIYWFTNKRIGEQFGSLFSIFFMLFVPLDFQHNLMYTYPFNFMIALVLFIFVLEFYLQYFESKKKKNLVISTILFFFLCMTYESFMAYLWVLFIIAFAQNIKTDDGDYNLKQLNIKKLFFDILPLFLAAFSYGIIYFIKGRVVTFDYDGTSVNSSFQPVAIIKTMVKYGIGYFPYRNMYTTHSLASFSLDKVTMEMILKAFIGTSVSAFIFLKIKTCNWKKGSLVIVAALGACFAFCIPFALTPKYQTWAEENTMYVPTFIGYYWIIIAMVAICCMILKFKKIKRLAIFLLCIFIFCTSILVDFTNTQTMKPLFVTSQKQLSFDALVSSDYFSSIPENSIIYTTDYTGVHNQLSSLEEYGMLTSGNSVEFTNDLDILTNYENVYYLSYSADSNLLALGKIDKKENIDNFLGDELYIIYPNSGTLILEKESINSEISVNGNPAGIYLQTAILPLDNTGSAIISADDIYLFKVSFAPQSIFSNAE